MTPTDAECAERARALREEALALIDGVGLGRLLGGAFGRYKVVGSVDLDLMTRPDIDVYVPVARAEPRTFLAALSPLYAAFADAGLTVFRAVFNDEWTLPRGDYGSGYYWGLRWHGSAGRVWKLDLWGWDPQTFARKVAQHEELGRALASKRDLVLRLKIEAQALADPEDRPASWDVYQFVSAGEGTTLEQLRAFCRDRRPRSAG